MLTEQRWLHVDCEELPKFDHLHYLPIIITADGITNRPMIYEQHMPDTTDVKTHRGPNIDSKHYRDDKTVPKNIHHQQCTVPTPASLQPSATDTTEPSHRKRATF